MTRSSPPSIFQPLHRLPLRIYDRTPFATQEAELRHLLTTLPVVQLSIDNGGIGINLAENLARDFPQVVPTTFTSATKERWATDFKILLQRRAVELPCDRSIVTDIHAIRRKVTTAGNVTFQVERSHKGGYGDRCRRNPRVPRSVTIFWKSVTSSRRRSRAGSAAILGRRRSRAGSARRVPPTARHYTGGWTTRLMNR